MSAVCQRFQDAVVTSYVTKSSKVAVFCDDGKSAFPADVSFQSFKNYNPSWKTVVLCTSNRCEYWSKLADEVYSVKGKGGFLGPKQYIYSAAVFLSECDIIAYLDLDLIHLAPMPDIGDSKLIHAVPDISAVNQSLWESVTDERNGIYHSTKADVAEFEKLKLKYITPMKSRVFNTGVVVLPFAEAKVIAHVLRTLDNKESSLNFLWRWMHRDRKNYFTRHREQAVFQIVAEMLQTGAAFSTLPFAYNWQVIDPMTHDAYATFSGLNKQINIIHFNGFANPKGPSRDFARKFFPGLLKNL
jgi:hypothetical protein